MESKRAVALRYEKQSDTAPRVVAKGSGAVAQAMLEHARVAGVTVHEDGSLTNALMQLEIDSVVPEELYAVVAEVLAYVYQQKSPERFASQKTPR